MNQLVTLDFENSTDLFIVPDEGSSIPRASINRDPFYGDSMEGVPVPSMKLEHPDHGPVFSKDVFIRIFATTMQTAVFDGDAEEYTNMSQHFIRFSDKVMDWKGGNKCNWVPSKQKEKLKAQDPVAYAKAANTKLYRHLFGVMRMDNAVIPGSHPVEFDPIPFRMRLGPSNFFEVGKVVGELEKVKKLKHFNYEFKVNFTVASKGQNKWFVLKYEPLIEDRIELSPDDHDALKVFQGIIKEENEFVVDKMRDNVGSSVAAEFVQDITPGE
jgi:hypothetical protein